MILSGGDCCSRMYLVCLLSAVDKEQLLRSVGSSRNSALLLSGAANVEDIDRSVASPATLLYLDIRQYLGTALDR